MCRKHLTCNHCKRVIRFLLVCHTIMTNVIENCNEAYIDLLVYTKK